MTISVQLEYLWSEIGLRYYNQFVQAMANQSIEDAVVTWEKVLKYLEILQAIQDVLFC